MIEDRCWVVTSGEAGMRSQALGLAEAVGLPIDEKRIDLRPPWTWLRGGLVPIPLSALHPAGDPLVPPWPRLVVACGRRSIGPALAVKRRSRGRTLVAYVQNPEFARAAFDLVVAMPHDNVSGPNVVTVRTALHQITPALLAQAAGEWRDRLARNGERLIGVLLGGDSASYRLSAGALQKLVSVLRNAHACGLAAAITTSRRTSRMASQTMQEALAAFRLGTLYPPTSENPYLGILALAERLIVTGESISMISEALATGRPVHILPLEGSGRRHDAFLARMQDDGLVSIIEGDTLDWNFRGVAPINATVEPARRIREMLSEQTAA